MSPSIFDDYENGVQRLLTDLENKFGRSSIAYQEAVNFQSQLHENVSRARQFQDTNELQARRNEIIYELNRLSLTSLGKEFNTFYIPQKRALQTIIHQESVAAVPIPATPEPAGEKQPPQLPGDDEICQSLAQMCYNRGISADQKEHLLVILREATMEKKKMTTASDLPLDELFSQSSKFLAYQLFSLGKCRREWPNMIVSDRITRESLEVLQAIQQQVLEIDLLIKQKSNEVSAGALPRRETEKIITALRGLRMEFASIDRHLRAGPLPFDVRDTLERHFNDLVYYTSKYLLLLDELADQYKQNRWRQ